MSKWRAIDDFRDEIFASDLPPTERFVLLVLSYNMNYDDLGGAYPGPALLAERTGLAHSTVRNALRSLCERGWIEQTDKGSSAWIGRRHTSTYRGVLSQEQAESTSDSAGSENGLSQEKARTQPGESAHSARSRTQTSQGSPQGRSVGKAGAAAPTTRLSASSSPQRKRTRKRAQVEEFDDEIVTASGPQEWLEKDEQRKEHRR